MGERKGYYLGKARGYLLCRDRLPVQSSMREAGKSSEALATAPDPGLRIEARSGVATKLESQPVRVLWIAPSFFPRLGGLEVYVEKLVGRLASICDVGLVTKSGQWLPGEDPISHFTVSEIQPRGFKARWQTGDELANIASRFAPDIVHLGGAEVAAHGWAIPASIPVVATVHGNDLTLARSTGPDPGHVSRITEGLNACEHVFAVSEHTAALCRQWGVTTPMSVVAAGCDTESFRPWPALGQQARADFRIPKGLPVILTVSRLVPRKGHMCILEAIRRLPFRVHWVVVGDGPCRHQLMREATRLGMAQFVSFWGAVSDDDLPGLYNACDLFVFTPEERRLDDGRIDSEGFGLVFLEASACGKPVIGTSVSGCKDAVIQGATGVLVPHSDPVRLSKAIEFLLRNSDVARNLGLAGLIFVRESGGWERLARQTLEKYQEILYTDIHRVEPPQLRIPL